MGDKNFDVHVYEPDQPVRSLDDQSRIVAGDGPMDAEMALIEANLRNRGHYRDGDSPDARFVAVFRVRDTDTWLELNGRIHPDDVGEDVFERVQKFVKDYEDTAEEVLDEPSC